MTIIPYKSLNITFSEFENFRTITKNIFSKYFDVNTYLKYKNMQNIINKTIHLNTNRKANSNTISQNSFHKKDLEDNVIAENNICREKLSESLYFSNDRDGKFKNHMDLKTNIPNLEGIYQDKNMYEQNNNDDLEEAICTICSNRKANIVLKCLVSAEFIIILLLSMLIVKNV